MKVGIFIGGIKPTDGGGYTYVADFLEALDRIAGDPKHEFIVFFDGSEEVAKRAAGLSRVNLQREKAGVLSGRERFFGKFPGVLGRTWDRAFRIAPELPWDARVYRKHNIEFVLRLVPWSAMTMDVPFGAVVWDLQHRNNPWFPEVCERGEWDGRERNFATLCRRASVILTGTSQGMEEIERYYQVPRTRVKVLPFPTPTFAMRSRDVSATPLVLEKFDLPRDYLFYPAQYWPHKNHVVVLEACHRLRDRAKWDIGVVFVGFDKGNQSYVKEYAAKLGLERSTRFLDYIGQDELVQLYKHAFCLTFATSCGPDNLPPLEAFALRCPVVASSVPGAQEQLGRAALLFPPTDEEALAECILGLRSTPSLRHELVEAGFRRASQNSWADYVAGVVDALDDFSRIRRAWR